MSNKSQRRNIEAGYARDYALDFQYVTKVGDAYVPVNLTGYTVTFEIKRHESYETPLSTTTGTTDSNGNVHFVISKTNNTLAPNRYYYNIKIVAPGAGGLTETLLWGNYNLNGYDRN